MSKKVSPQFEEKPNAEQAEDKSKYRSTHLNDATQQILQHFYYRLFFYINSFFKIYLIFPFLAPNPVR
jgi:hypothetical protein